MMRRIVLAALLALLPAIASAQMALIAPDLPAGDNSDRIANSRFVESEISRNTTHFAAGGTATCIGNALTIASVSPPVFSFTGNPTVTFTAGCSPNGATTLNVAGSGAKNVLRKTATGLVALVTNDIINGQQYLATYDGTQYELQTPSSLLPAAASALGGVTSATAGANQFQTGISTAGAPTFAQPSFTNLSGAATTAQLPAGVYAQTINVQTISYTIATSDCGGTVQMGTGATGQLNLTLPAVAGFTGPCPIRVYNGDAYSAGVGRGKIMVGFPADQFYILFPHQSFDIKISGGAWIVDRPAGRYAQTGIQLYVRVAGGSSDTTNDCLSPTTACASINKAVNGILYPVIDNQNSAPIVFLYGGGTWSECVVAAGQLHGVNVAFIEGVSGQALWNASGACAAFLIGDNAEFETQNITFSSPPANGSGVFIHQPGVVDLLSGTHFGSFSGTGSAIGSDQGGFINFAQGGGTLNIGPGNTGTFLALGRGTQMTGSITATFITNPTIGVWMTINGAGANAAWSGFAISGANTTGVSTCRGPSAFYLGASMPGGAPTATLGCQSL